jgi:hypothetical protein
MNNFQTWVTFYAAERKFKPTAFIPFLEKYFQDGDYMRAAPPPRAKADEPKPRGPVDLEA